jgi:hypothetical protein
VVSATNECVAFMMLQTWEKERIAGKAPELSHREEVISSEATGCGGAYLACDEAGWSRENNKWGSATHKRTLSRSRDQPNRGLASRNLRHCVPLADHRH